MLKRWFKAIWERLVASAAVEIAKLPEPAPKGKPKGLSKAIVKAQGEKPAAIPYRYEIKPPELMPGVVPKNEKAPVMAMDDGCYDFARSTFGFGGFGGVEFVGFPGYPRLAMLATRPEYRAFAQATATQLTREWIVLQSSDTSGDSEVKITKLTQAISDLGLKDVIQRAAEHDSYYGRAQIFVEIDNQDRSVPLVLDKKTIPLGAKFRITTVEPMWTTPKTYNSIDPGAKDFYKPPSWFMLGQEVHSSRLLTIITREVPDMLKPAFNFGGISMSQLAEAYVDNWLRTRQSVSDLINNFSIVTLSTAMDQVLQGDDNGDDLLKRAQLFTLHRNNQGLMLLDKEREEIDVLNVPLSGLSELQSQSQEQMCAVSHTPAVVLLGIAPTGFGNVAEGEIRTYYDWIAAIQEAYWRKPIETVIDILQIILFGDIDPTITFTFQPLYQMTPKELAEIRTADANTDAAYIDRGVVDPIETREKLARNPESGYQGLDLTKIPEQQSDPNPQEMENEDVP